MTDIKRVGVLGSGLMGSGIAQVAAAAGYDTTVRDVSQQVWDKARAGIEKSLAKFVEKGKLAAADRDATLKRLRFTTTTADLRSEEHTSELQSRLHLVCRLLLEKKKKTPDRRRTNSARASARS